MYGKISFSPGSVVADTRVKYGNVTDADRKAYCESLKNLIVEPTSELPVTSVQVNSLGMKTFALRINIS